jgi:hypothetical protein
LVLTVPSGFDAPVIVSGLLLALFVPLILGLSNGYEPSTGYSERAYLSNWLIVTGVLGAPSGSVYVLQIVRGRRILRRDSGLL